LPFLRMPGGQGVVGSDPASPTHRRRSGAYARPSMAVEAARVAIHVAATHGSPSSGTVRPRSFRLHAGRLRTLADGCGSVVTSARVKRSRRRRPGRARRRRTSGGCRGTDRGASLVVGVAVCVARTEARIEVGRRLTRHPRRGAGGAVSWSRADPVCTPWSTWRTLCSSSSLGRFYAGHFRGEVAPGPRVYTTR